MAGAIIMTLGAAASSFLLAVVGVLVVQGAVPPQSVSVEQPAIQRELLRRQEMDQDARAALISFMKAHGSNGIITVEKLSPELRSKYEVVERHMTDVDTSNTKWLKGVIARNGWPTAALVGQSGTSAAWLLVQHADRDPAFQRTCLDLMVKLPKDAVSQQHLALLTDRVLLAEGKKQLYGTQFTTIDGKLLPRPIEDQINVDMRRAEAGLPPLAEYVKILERQYGVSSRKK